MSLDVYIHYKKPKAVHKQSGFNQSACGSTLAYYERDVDEIEEMWHTNITHNMNRMAMHIPTLYEINGGCYECTLYEIVWRPEELGVGNVCNNTDIVQEGLRIGIAYMVDHRAELLQFNPENGWGDYGSFLAWLVEYRQACVENPDCKISISR